MLSVTITVGIIGSMKSTYARKLAEKNPDIVIVCKDDIREMLYGAYKFKPADETMIHTMAITCMLSALAAGKSVIMDETNLSREKRSRIIEVVRNYYTNNEVSINAMLFSVGEECLQRRLADPREISEFAWTKIYNDMLAVYEVPTISEGFNYIYLDESIQNDIQGKTYNNQVLYCLKNKVPVLIPMDMICFGCKTNLTDLIKIEAETRHITSCPKCNYSFCN